MTYSVRLIVHLVPLFKIKSVLRLIGQCFSDGQKTLWCVRSASSLTSYPANPRAYNWLMAIRLSE
jgi:hypothetical protein